MYSSRLIKEKTRVTFAFYMVCLLFANFTNSYSQNWGEVIKAVASDRGVQDYFGCSVSISGNYAIVGAYQEDHDLSGDNRKSSAGSAYIFELDSNNEWVEVQKLVASDRDTYSYFGYSVSISGNYAVAGAYMEYDDASGNNPLSYAGAAYIFERDLTGNWMEVQKIVASDRSSIDYFGYSVAIDGDYLVVGAYLENEDASGNNSLNFAGAAYVFERGLDGIWVEAQKITASDRNAGDYFGFSVSVSDNYIIVGSYEEDEDASGVNTLSSSGAAYVFERDSIGVFTEVQKLVASDRAVEDYFGCSVAISGNYIIVGSYGEDEDTSGVNTLSGSGAAYVFERDSIGVFTEVQKLVAPDRGVEDYFGYSVAISGNYTIVGAFQEDEDALEGSTILESGSAYIFQLNEFNVWEEVQKLVATNRAEEDYFGVSVSISDNRVLVGAYGEDQDASELNFNISAGAAYVFHRLDSFTISSSANLGGNITPLGNRIVSEGDDITYQITPDVGYAVNEVLVNSVSQGTIDMYTFTNVTFAGIIQVVFEIDTDGDGIVNSVDDDDDGDGLLDEDDPDPLVADIITNVKLIELSKIVVSPNPAQDQVIIKLSDSYASRYAMAHLCNLAGQVVKTFQLVRGENIFGVSELSRGVYILRVDKKYIIKVVLK